MSDLADSSAPRGREYYGRPLGDLPSSEGKERSDRKNVGGVGEEEEDASFNQHPPSLLSYSPSSAASQVTVMTTPTFTYYCNKRPKSSLECLAEQDILTSFSPFSAKLGRRVCHLGMVRPAAREGANLLLALEGDKDGGEKRERSASLTPADHHRGEGGVTGATSGSFIAGLPPRPTTSVTTPSKASHSSNEPGQHWGPPPPGAESSTTRPPSAAETPFRLTKTSGASNNRNTKKDGEDLVAGSPCKKNTPQERMRRIQAIVEKSNEFNSGQRKVYAMQKHMPKLGDDAARQQQQKQKSTGARRSVISEGEADGLNRTRESSLSSYHQTNNNFAGDANENNFYGNDSTMTDDATEADTSVVNANDNSNNKGSSASASLPLGLKPSLFPLKAHFEYRPYCSFEPYEQNAHEAALREAYGGIGQPPPPIRYRQDPERNQHMTHRIFHQKTQSLARERGFTTLGIPLSSDDQDGDGTQNVGIGGEQTTATTPNNRSTKGGEGESEVSGSQPQQQQQLLPLAYDVGGAMDVTAHLVSRPNFNFADGRFTNRGHLYLEYLRTSADYFERSLGIDPTSPLPTIAEMRTGIINGLELGSEAEGGSGGCGMAEGRPATSLSGLRGAVGGERHMSVLEGRRGKHVACDTSTPVRRGLIGSRMSPSPMVPRNPSSAVNNTQYQSLSLERELSHQYMMMPAMSDTRATAASITHTRRAARAQSAAVAANRIMAHSRMVPTTSTTLSSPTASLRPLTSSSLSYSQQPLTPLRTSAGSGQSSPSSTPTVGGGGRALPWRLGREVNITSIANASMRGGRPMTSTEVAQQQRAASVGQHRRYVMERLKEVRELQHLTRQDHPLRTTVYC